MSMVKYTERSMQERIIELDRDIRFGHTQISVPVSKNTKGTFLLSELAGQTHQFARKMQQFERALA